MCASLPWQASVARAQMPTVSSDYLASPFHAGVRASYLRNFHSTNGLIWPACPTCGTFSNGQGNGFGLEFFGEVPFNSFRLLDITFGAGWTDRGGNFGQIVTGGLPILDPNTNQYVTLTRQSAYTSSLNYLDLEAGLKLRPLRSFAGYTGASLEIGVPLGRSTSYVQTESILSPQGVTYPQSQTTTLVDGSGEIPNLHTSFGVSALIGYEFPLRAIVKTASDALTIAPELSYYFPLNSVESEFPWHVSSLRAGVAVRWNMPFDYIPPAPKPEPPPIVAHENPNAEAPKLTVVSLSSAPFHIIETTVTETFPILPYVFFDSASAIIPDRFAQLTPGETLKFAESELPHHSLESYYNLLNVIGRRLQMNGDAILTINGTTDGREVASLDASKDLAKRRATIVRNYFLDIWKIAPKRLIVTTSDAPLNPSSTEYAEGFEENRRVELSSDDDRILKPIVHERFREESASPKVLPLQLSATNRIGVRDWHVAIRSHGVSVYESEGQGAPPSQIEWKPTDEQVDSIAKVMQVRHAGLSDAPDSLSCELRATAINGASSSLIVALPASKSVNPFELSRLSLIVFDFDQANINAQNQRMISQFVGKSFYSVSTASIVGSTDNLGELQHNQKLSEGRAFNVRDLILRNKPDAKITSTKGIGPSQLLYDNHLPEGRYYCRTVKVEVETPLEAVVKLSEP
jgi:outer membrane protein OmpA-like peptidoglycan-associated protein